MKMNGFTLIEIMIVVAIIGVIAMVAIPSYTNYVSKATRSVATSMLTQASNRQEQFFIDNKQYASTMTQLGFGANPVLAARDGQTTTVAADAAYSISITNQSATTYTIVATALGAQSTRDADCTPMTLTHRGQKAPANCW